MEKCDTTASKSQLLRTREIFSWIFLKEYISNCALGYKKVLLYENVEIESQSNMAFHSILPKKRHQKVPVVPYCSFLISAFKNKRFFGWIP